LYATDRQRLVLDRHCNPVLGARGDVEHVWYTVALDEQRMIAADHDLIRQASHQAPAPHLHPRRPAMRRMGELTELAAEIFADRLHAETHAEDRQLLVQRRANRVGHPEILRPAWTRRQHQKVPAPLFQQVERMHITDHGDGGADLAEVIRQHMNKAVVMVDQEHLLAASGRIRRKGRQRLRRIAA